jgi:hypothetical protein
MAFARKTSGAFQLIAISLLAYEQSRSTKAVSGSVCYNYNSPVSQGYDLRKAIMEPGQQFRLLPRDGGTALVAIYLQAP